MGEWMNLNFANDKNHAMNIIFSYKKKKYLIYFKSH